MFSYIYSFLTKGFEETINDNNTNNFGIWNWKAKQNTKITFWLTNQNFHLKSNQKQEMH